MFTTGKKIYMNSAKLYRERKLMTSPYDPAEAMDLVVQDRQGQV